MNFGDRSLAELLALQTLFAARVVERPANDDGAALEPFDHRLHIDDLAMNPQGAGAVLLLRLSISCGVLFVRCR